MRRRSNGRITPGLWALFLREAGLGNTPDIWQLTASVVSGAGENQIPARRQRYRVSAPETPKWRGPGQRWTTAQPIRGPAQRKTRGGRKRRELMEGISLEESQKASILTDSSTATMNPGIRVSWFNPAYLPGSAPPLPAGVAGPPQEKPVQGVSGDRTGSLSPMSNTEQVAHVSGEFNPSVTSSSHGLSSDQRAATLPDVPRAGLWMLIKSARSWFRLPRNGNPPRRRQARSNWRTTGRKVLLRGVEHRK
jgi:hypothetical protein